MKKGKAPPPQTRQAMYDEAADVLLGALPPVSDEEKLYKRLLKFGD